MNRYVKDLRGRVVKATEYKPTGDQNPEGKAARRRRKQMERQLQKAMGPIELVEKAGCDACGLDAVDRCPHCQMATCGKCGVCEHWAGKPGVVVDQCLDGGAIRTWTDDDGEIRQEYTPKEQLVVESNPTDGPGLAQRLFVDRAKFATQYLSDIDQIAGGYFNHPANPEPGKRLVLDGTVSVGVDPARPDGDVTTVALRKGNTITILDEASQVPQHVWDEFGADVSRRINERIAAELGGGKPPPENKAATRHAVRAWDLPYRGLLAAVLLGLLGTDKPKE